MKSTLLLVAALAFACATAFAVEPPRPAKPNVVFFLSDDHAAQAIGCYGGKLMKTPNLDRIANAGMRFDRCFCTESICGPSRAAILTGKLIHYQGAVGSDDGTPNGNPKQPRQVDEWELFDLQTDPQERLNLYNKPAAQTIIPPLKEELNRLQRELKDTP
jgi:arylsulfatase A-like enzyme